MSGCADNDLDIKIKDVLIWLLMIYYDYMERFVVNKFKK